MLDTAVPAAHVKLNENATTAFDTLFNVIKAICSVLDMEFPHLTELHEREKGESLFGNADSVLTGLLHNAVSKPGKTCSKHDIFTIEDIRNLVELSGNFCL